MVAIICVGGVVLLWRFLIVLGTVVFETVGLSPQAAGFEARSALVGAGYTTSQSEPVARNPAARRVASILVISGYFGPTTVLALLGVGFVVPTSDDLSQRGLVLAALIVGLFVVDRLGIIRSIGTRPARAVARRLLANSTFEALIDVGDHMVASLTVPLDGSRADDLLVLLRSPAIKILAIDRGDQAPTLIPTDTDPIETCAGDRVVLFGPRDALEPLRATA
jgi:hypothetical protein